ncbi:hypothetical protein SAMN05661008_00815 [Alkalithermobacter thermoalcaliphilus JW-YL-7 = DSM 7308]|uniref:Uncharacterized protein n=1 Tax=Alkalithermobacter thermoalcaliphilus JW-YL-7 = DSM 7308 TaxID=1121328 RepID=A0A150FQU2_CLOPD|nr:hypothetical protein JWYL7_1037 [[Clostridium] paradoxum JW-YL-7 = DSM 7308]SHK75469.1 hypothetical protein SAMN05661008_00815 [[Clostridium] paradoxum JW-YL-7 = DSM 7308]
MKEDITKKLEKAGIKDEKNISIEDIKSAVADVIVETEEEMKKQTEILNKIKWMYNR